MITVMVERTLFLVLFLQLSSPFLGMVSHYKIDYFETLNLLEPSIPAVNLLFKPKFCSCISTLLGLGAAAFKFSSAFWRGATFPIDKVYSNHKIVSVQELNKK